MTWETTDAYKVLMARAMMGETVDLAAATLHVGDGATFTGGEPDPPTPSDTTLGNELASAAIVSLDRSSYVVTAAGRIPGGGASLTVNEVCFKTGSGVMIARATFQPITFQAPFNYENTLELQPEA